MTTTKKTTKQKKTKQKHPKTKQTNKQTNKKNTTEKNMLLPQACQGKGSMIRDRLVGLVVKASASRAAEVGSIPDFPAGLCPGQVIPMTFFLPPRWPRERKIPGSNPTCDGIFPGRLIPVTKKMALQQLPCQAPGVKGSALGLVGPISVYCDWVRSATSISVWQHVNLSLQIRP